ncbi:hypothetical protein Syun_006918 [Stephania yunnanensis]|uniref:Uncharacterized protein n=1 Tax=Stephania yunnanensis TaxID=152371 RepID=A0AAP0KZ84_9MAGN
MPSQREISLDQSETATSTSEVPFKLSLCGRTEVFDLQFAHSLRVSALSSLPLLTLSALSSLSLLTLSASSLSSLPPLTLSALSSLPLLTLSAISSPAAHSLRPHPCSSPRLHPCSSLPSLSPPAPPRTAAAEYAEPSPNVETKSNKTQSLHTRNSAYNGGERRRGMKKNLNNRENVGSREYDSLKRTVVGWWRASVLNDKYFGDFRQQFWVPLPIIITLMVGTRFKGFVTLNNSDTLGCQILWFITFRDKVVTLIQLDIVDNAPTLNSLMDGVRTCTSLKTSQLTSRTQRRVSGVRIHGVGRPDYPRNIVRCVSKYVESCRAFLNKKEFKSSNEICDDGVSVKLKEQMRDWWVEA